MAWPRPETSSKCVAADATHPQQDATLQHALSLSALSDFPARRRPGALKAAVSYHGSSDYGKLRELNVRSASSQARRVVTQATRFNTPRSSPAASAAPQ